MDAGAGDEGVRHKGPAGVRVRGLPRPGRDRILWSQAGAGHGRHAGGGEPGMPCGMKAERGQGR